MDFAIKLEDFIPSHGDLVISGDSDTVVNSGQFLFRTSSVWVRKMFEFANKGCVNDFPCQCGKGHGDQILYNYFVFGDCDSSKPKLMQQKMMVQNPFQPLPTLRQHTTIGMKDVCQQLLSKSKS